MSERAVRVRDLFVAAVDLPTGERDHYLARNCGADLALHQEVAALLATTPAALFLEPPELDTVVPPVPPTQFGPYSVVRRLDAKADAWLARDATSGRVVRIEVHTLRESLPRPGPDAEGEADAADRIEARIAQFVRQVHSVQRLGARQCVRVHEHGLDARGLWVAMDHIDGPSLQTALDQRCPTDEPLAIAPLGLVVATALAATHAIGVAHGTLTASRILLDPSGRPFLCGLGDAALRGGLPPTAEDDVRALGRLLRDLLALRPSAKHTLAERAVEAIALRALRIDRNQPLSMATLTEQLSHVVHGTVAAARPGFAARLRRWLGRA